MTERLLQYIWQFQYYNQSSLTTTGGEMLTVLHPGQYNTNQGPDFLDARIVIGDKTWAGHIELHVAASDWEKHRHGNDKHYNNVILHVVWENDMPESRMPVLVLEDKVAYFMMDRYKELMRSNSHIPCGSTVGTIHALTWQAWKDRLLAERLQRKAGQVLKYLGDTNQHWEESFWWMLARSFGLKVNADAFEAIARSIPLSVLAKNRSNLSTLEALLLGQAGLLEGKFSGEYPCRLQEEYHYQQQKYQLKPVNMPVYFLRMRPGSFPTVRLAQLAMLLFHSVHLFGKVRDASSAKEIRDWLDVTASDYWHYHYRFDTASPFKKKILGASMISNIMINTIAPVLFALGEHLQDDTFRERAVQWLAESAPEFNNITKRYMLFGIANKNAFDSQALTEQFNEYCSRKRCLECTVLSVYIRK